MEKNKGSFDIEKFVKKDVEKIWKKYENYNFIKYPPVTVKYIFFNSIIFIGLNPSLIDKSNRNLHKLESYVLYHERKDNYRYFNKFTDIANELSLKWSHIDLLYYQNTKQKKIEKMLRKTSDPESNFINDQLKVTSKLIISIINNTNPKLFVVNNAFARKLFFNEKPFVMPNTSGETINFLWDDKIGTYLYKSIPFYFTGMLTGQRALDNGSYKRLTWQIKHYLRNDNKKHSY
ncbi:MAG: hypothetical protein P9M11_00395 [Candidatus Tenebribacter burtonii]|jgi:hypothetical protein|nr:hypothetical protein [Candidatus Tenebribacter burtonii]